MTGLLDHLLRAARPGRLPSLAAASRRPTRVRGVARADRRSTRRIGHALRCARAALEGLGDTLDHDVGRLRVVGVATHPDLAAARAGGVDAELVHVAAGCWQRGVLARALVHVTLLADDATEQIEVLLTLGPDLRERNGRLWPAEHQRTLWAGGTRRATQPDLEPFVDAVSLRHARAALDGEARGGGGLLVAA